MCSASGTEGPQGVQGARHPQEELSRQALVEEVVVVVANYGEPTVSAWVAGLRALGALGGALWARRALQARGVSGNIHSKQAACRQW